jgi:ferredoxin
MPTVTFRGRELDCEDGAVLRDVLRAGDVSPHNGAADSLNCRGHGTCGTCAVEVRPAASGGDGADDDSAGGDATPPVDPMGATERRRLSFPPHDVDAGLRLSCQTRVRGDLLVRKYPGFWGQHADREPVGDVD